MINNQNAVTMEPDNDQVDNTRFLRGVCLPEFCERQLLFHKRGQKQHYLSETNSLIWLPARQVQKETGNSQAEKGVWLRLRVDCESQKAIAWEKPTDWRPIVRLGPSVGLVQTIAQQWRRTYTSPTRNCRRSDATTPLCVWTSQLIELVFIGCFMWTFVQSTASQKSGTKMSG